MKSEEFVKKVYVCELEGSNQKGRPLGRWRDKVKEYMCERGDSRGGGLDRARRDCLDRERWRLFCRGHPLENVPRGSEVSEREIVHHHSHILPLHPTF